jgi:S-adenosylmethionine:tRNA ribosyltransferase-isomerase
LNDIHDLLFYDYTLPEELIAQTPLEPRDASRLMIIDRKTAAIRHDHFYNLPSYLNPGDCIVINNTKVIPARIYGKKDKTGAAIEILLSDKIENDEWEVMMRNSRRVNEGDTIIFKEGLSAVITKKLGKTVLVKFNTNGPEFYEKINKTGIIPLPPYIKENTNASIHKHRYQTVFAKKEGAKAAPTASLHFTNELIQKIVNKGIIMREITLHTGLGTFEPVNESDITKHKMHSEDFQITGETASSINLCRKNGGRIIAAGTTSLRALESSADMNGEIHEKNASTNIFIYPGYKFKAVDCLITNFHFPKTTLLALVYAFAGVDLARNAYNEAILQKYRLFSYGDAMLII